MIVACVPGVAGNFSSVCNHKPRHTHTQRDPCHFFSLPLVLVLCSLYSDHVRPGPCHWPSKERLITGKRRILFAFAFSVSRFLGFLPPSSLSLSARLSLSLLFISRSPLFSLPCLYFLLCRVKSENTELRVLHPQIPACSLLGWILKAKGGTKVQIRFFWIVLLLIQTCPCYLSLSQLLWAAGKGCGKCVCIWLCVFRGHGGNSWSYENAHSGCETWAYCVMVGWLSVHSLTIWETSSNELLNHYFS